MAVDLELATTKQLVDELLSRNAYGFVMLVDKQSSENNGYYYQWKGNTVEILGCISYFQEAYSISADNRGAFTPDNEGNSDDEELEDND